MAVGAEVDRPGVGMEEAVTGSAGAGSGRIGREDLRHRHGRMRARSQGRRESLLLEWGASSIHTI